MMFNKILNFPISKMVYISICQNPFFTDLKFFIRQGPKKEIKEIGDVVIFTDKISDYIIKKIKLFERW